MVTSCNSIWLLTNLFLWVALITAAIETAMTLWIKWETWKKPPSLKSDRVIANPGDWAKLLEALTKLLQALKDKTILAAGLDVTPVDAPRGPRLNPKFIHSSLQAAASRLWPHLRPRLLRPPSCPCSRRLCLSPGWY